MSKLSLEVLFTIMTTMKAKALLGLSLVDREFRQVCQDKTLWTRIFNKHNLVMLRKSHGIASWVLNFNDSLSSRRLVSKTMENLDKIYSIKKIIDDTSLQEIKDVSIVHVPGVTRKDELETFISFHNLFRRKKSAFLASHVYLCLEKEEDVYYMTISEDNFCLEGEDKIQHVKYKLDREQVCLLLYKLSYHRMLSLSSWVVC
ncbi:F-box domain-containing protein [Cedratvirus Zaza IHUMI]|uniref:F-box domain-containing protein n=1 Tax=Cedratvirus Zaza IHUMI TaxID=2126979 RepID=A0A2R8FEK6_9VIRU|nr:F-box domain-containing protein [Cedratvirus Zaza IHUMI]